MSIRTQLKKIDFCSLGFAPHPFNIALLNSQMSTQAPCGPSELSTSGSIHQVSKSLGQADFYAILDLSGFSAALMMS